MTTQLLVESSLASNSLLNFSSLIYNSGTNDPKLWGIERLDGDNMYIYFKRQNTKQVVK